MPWTHRFSHPIKLKDGRPIASLEEGGNVILSLPSSAQRPPCWIEAVDLIFLASRFPSFRNEAATAMVRALIADDAFCEGEQRFSACSF
jgi:hypothetical protein